MSNITVSQEQIQEWISDINQIVVMGRLQNQTEMRERLYKLSSLLKTMGSELDLEERIKAVKQGSVVVPPRLKQEHILEIISAIIDAIQWEKLKNSNNYRPEHWRREFLEELKIPFEFKKMMGNDFKYRG